MRRVKKTVYDRKGQALGEAAYDEPETLQEAVEFFGESKVCLNFCRQLQRDEIEKVRKRATNLSVPQAVREMLRKDPELVRKVLASLGKG